MTETTTTQRAPAPDPALMELDVLAGDWRFEGDVREGPAGPAAPVRGTTSFEWFEGGWCLVQHADTVFEGPARYTIEPSRHGTVVFDWSLPDGDGVGVPWIPTR